MKVKVGLVSTLFLIVTWTVGNQSVSVGSQHHGTLLTARTPAAGMVAITPLQYSFDLKAGEVATLAIDKPGTDLELQLSGPDGRILRSVNCLHSGSLRMSEIAATAGEYVVQMHSCPGVEVPYTLTLSSVN